MSTGLSGGLLLGLVAAGCLYFGWHLDKACSAGRLPVCKAEWHELGP